jgi:hypothetical protein
MWGTGTDTVKRLMESGTEEEEDHSESESKKEGNAAFIHHLRS